MCQTHDILLNVSNHLQQLSISKKKSKFSSGSLILLDLRENFNWSLFQKEIWIGIDFPLGASSRHNIRNLLWEGKLFLKL